MRQTVTEDDIQATIVQGLEVMQYRVFVTSRRVRRCQHCGRFPRKAPDGVTKGLPDLFITKDTWPAGVFLGIEVKGPTTAVSEDQQALVDAERYTVVRSWEAAIAEVKAFEVRLIGAKPK